MATWNSGAVREAPDASRVERIRSVVLDGLVVLKIIKHVQENFPVAVAGSLLGLDVADTLEVTHSFPFPSAEAGEDAGGEEYELEMLKAVREINIDNNSVGWYTSTYLGSYCTKDTIQHQYEFQDSLPNSVVLIYDSVRTSQGQLAFKALRLTDSFCAAYAAKKVNLDSISSLSPALIFEELPVRIRNPHLIQATFAQLVASNTLLLRPLVAAAAAPTAASSAHATGASAASAAERSGTMAATAAALASGAAASAIGDADVDYARLDLNAAPVLEKHLDLLTDITDQLLRAQVEVTTHTRRAEENRRRRDEWIARRREENEIRKAAGDPLLPEEDMSLPFFRPQPELRTTKDSVDILLMSAQVSSYCTQVSRFAGASFGKLFLAGGLHKSTAGPTS